MSPILLTAKQWLGPDVVEADARQRITRLNRIFLLITASLTTLRALGVLSALPESAPIVYLAALTVLASLALLWSQRLGRVRLTAYLTATVFWFAVNAAAIFAGGIDRPFFATNVTVLIFVALTLGARVTAIFGLATVVAGAAMFVARLNVLLPVHTLPTDLVVGSTTQHLVHLRRGALLHDIGKMSIPDSILLKPGPLTPTEWTVMRRHPQVAFDLLFSINFLRPALDIPYCHHEKWDGTGYPRGLQGLEISLAARMFAVVDVWDALRFDRPYRLAWPEARVLAYIREQTGKHFDPQVVAAFLELAEGSARISLRAGHDQSSGLC